MKKMIICLLTLGIMVNVAFAEQLGVRNTKWGMSKEEVMALEKLPIQDETNTGLYYMTEVTLDGMPAMACRLTYGFTLKNELAFVSYFMGLERETAQECINDYQTAKNILIKDYGQPEGSIIDQLTQGPEIAETEIPEALMSGKIQFFTWWNLNKYHIGFSMSTYRNGLTAMEVFYADYDRYLKWLDDSSRNKGN